MAVAIRSICTADEAAQRLFVHRARAARHAAMGIDSCGFTSGGLARLLRNELVTANIALAFAIALIFVQRTGFACACALATVLLLSLSFTGGFPPYFELRPESSALLWAFATGSLTVLLWRGAFGSDVHGSQGPMIAEPEQNRWASRAEPR